MQTSPFNFISSYVWYSMEKLAGDLLLGLKFVKLPIPNVQHETLA